MWAEAGRHRRSRSLALTELARWRRFAFEAPLVGLLLLALLGGIGAYQVRRPQVVDVGGIHDVPYLNAFHEPEPDRRQVPNPDEDYRWTRENVEIHLRGMGRQDVEVRLRMQAYRPAGQELPRVTLLVGGIPTLATEVGSSWQVYTALLPSDVLAGGDLHVTLQSTTFQPSGDPRELGVSVDWVEVHPRGLGWVGPAWPQVGCILGATLLAYLLLRRWGLGKVWSSGLVTIGVGILAILLAWHRLSLTHFTTTLVLLLAWGVLLTALLWPLLERVRRRSGWTRSELGWLGAILLLGFLVRMGGMLYPQFRSSDLIFHAHRAEWVAAGTVLFTADLPDVNIPAPYPPGLYVAMLPAMLLSLDTPLVMQVVGVALDTLCGLLLYLLARHLSGRPRVAVLALLLQEVAPVTYKIYSWGNYTNLFSRAALLGSLVLLCLGRWRRGQVRGWVFVVGAFSLVLLGHFADSLIFVGLIMATAGLSLLTATGRRATVPLLAALALAGGLALGLYYTAPPGWDALLGGVQVVLRGEGRPAGLLNPLPQFIEHVQAPLVLLALPGLVLLPRRVWRWPWVPLAGALLTATVFAGGQALFGFSVRYSLFVLPVLALGAGNLLGLLWEKGRAGRLATGVLLAVLVGNGLWQWWWTVGFGQR